MNLLLIFFALPLATILLAMVLQKFIKCPLMVAAIFFAIYLILAIAQGNLIFLVAAIVYTFLAYVAAAIMKIIACFLRSYCCQRKSIYEQSDFWENQMQNDVIAGQSANEQIRNSNRCYCQVRRSHPYENEYNKGYVRGYDNGYQNAISSYPIERVNQNRRCGYASQRCR